LLVRIARSALNPRADDPCHGKVLDESHQAVDCRRRMNGYEQSVSDAVWSWGRGDHDTGQSLCDLIWPLRAEAPVDDLKAAIVAGIKAIQPPLNVIDTEPLATAPVGATPLVFDHIEWSAELFGVRAAVSNDVAVPIGTLLPDGGLRNVHLRFTDPWGRDKHEDLSLLESTGFHTALVTTTLY
jgi:hypothetical protein